MKRINIFLLGAVGCMLVLMAAGCKHPFLKKDTPRVVKVRTMEMHDNVHSGSREYVGILEANSASELSFNSAGRVTHLYVKNGQRVRQGQLLASVDKTMATSSYKAAQATLERARDGYERAKQVHDQGSLPEVRWVEIQTDLQQAEAACEIARQRLDECDLYAPHGGTIDSRQVERGSSVSPFQPVMRLLDLSRIYARINVPDIDINEVRQGDTATLIVSALQEPGEKTLKAVVEERMVSADMLSHSYSVRLRLLQRPKEILPGMVCRVSFATHDNTTGFEVPNRAVQLTHDGNRFVWVVNGGMAERRLVQIGDLTRTGVIITGGLQEGDSVVTDGMVKISNGTRVEIED